MLAMNLAALEVTEISYDRTLEASPLRAGYFRGFFAGYFEFTKIYDDLTHMKNFYFSLFKYVLEMCSCVKKTQKSYLGKKAYFLFILDVL